MKKLPQLELLEFGLGNSLNRGATNRRKGEGGGLPCPVLKTEKSNQILEKKNALTVFI